MSIGKFKAKSFWQHTKGIWIPRRDIIRRGDAGFISIPQIGAIAGSRRRSAGGGTSPGLGSIIAFYDFGNATDADGGTYNLNELNSPAYTAGPPNYGTSTNGAPGAYWQQTSLDNNFSAVAGNWSFVIRFRALSGTANNDAVFTSNGGRSRVLYNTTAIAGRLCGTSASPTSTVAGVINTWYTVVLSHSDSGATSSISVNNETFVTVSVTNSYAVGTSFFGANSSTDSNDFDIDFAGFWNKELTQDNVTWLYNSGGTRLYSEL